MWPPKWHTIQTNHIKAPLFWFEIYKFPKKKDRNKNQNFQIQFSFSFLRVKRAKINQTVDTFFCMQHKFIKMFEHKSSIKINKWIYPSRHHKKWTHRDQSEQLQYQLEKKSKRQRKWTVSYGIVVEFHRWKILHKINKL